MVLPLSYNCGSIFQQGLLSSTRFLLPFFLHSRSCCPYTSSQVLLPPETQLIVWCVSFHVFIYAFLKFIYFWRWAFLGVCGLSLVVESGGYSLLRCAGFSLRWLLLLQSMGSRHAGFSSCGTRCLERRLSSCGTWALLLHSMWDLPGPGIEPMSPALAGRFSTTAPPGKPDKIVLLE